MWTSIITFFIVLSLFIMFWFSHTDGHHRSPFETILLHNEVRESHVWQFHERPPKNNRCSGCSNDNTIQPTTLHHCWTNTWQNHWLMHALNETTIKQHSLWTSKACFHLFEPTCKRINLSLHLHVIRPMASSFFHLIRCRNSFRSRFEYRVQFRFHFVLNFVRNRKVPCCTTSNSNQRSWHWPQFQVYVWNILYVWFRHNLWYGVHALRLKPFPP